MAGRPIALPTTIADYLISHPTASRQDVADYFGLAYSTVCTVVRADSFEVLLQERKADLIAASMGSVYDTAAAVCEQGLEKLSRVIEKTENGEFLLETVSRLMAHGVRASAPEAPGQAQSVHVHIGGEALEGARRAMLSMQPARELPPALPNPKKSEGLTNQDDQGAAAPPPPKAQTVSAPPANLSALFGEVV